MDNEWNERVWQFDVMGSERGKGVGNGRWVVASIHVYIGLHLYFRTNIVIRDSPSAIPKWSDSRSAQRVIGNLYHPQPPTNNSRDHARGIDVPTYYWVSTHRHSMLSSSSISGHPIEIFIQQLFNPCVPFNLRSRENSPQGAISRVSDLYRRLAWRPLRCWHRRVPSADI